MRIIIELNSNGPDRSRIGVHTSGAVLNSKATLSIEATTFSNSELLEGLGARKAAV